MNVRFLILRTPTTPHILYMSFSVHSWAWEEEEREKDVKWKENQRERREGGAGRERDDIFMLEAGACNMSLYIYNQV